MNNRVKTYLRLMELVKKRLIKDGKLLSTEEQCIETLIQIGSDEIGSELRKVIPALEHRDKKRHDLRDLVGKSCYTYIKKGRLNQANEDKYSIDSRTLEALFQLAEEDDEEKIIMSLKRKWRSLSLLSIYIGFVGWKGFFSDKPVTIEAYLDNPKTKELDLSIKSEVKCRADQHGNNQKKIKYYRLWNKLSKRLVTSVFVLAALFSIIENKEVFFELFNLNNSDQKRRKNRESEIYIGEITNCSKFPNDKHGILILDICKDDSLKTQRDDIVSTLNSNINPGLNIEVRSCNVQINISNGIDNAHVQARLVGTELNAKVVIWGNLNPDKDKFHARFTIVEDHPNKVLEREITLDPVSVKEFDLPNSIITEPIIITGFLVGHSFLYDSKYQSAIKYFEEVLHNTKSKPFIAVTQLHLGIAYLQLFLKNRDELFYTNAMSHLTYAINKNIFTKTSALWNRGVLYANNGLYQEAIIDFNEAEKLIGKNYITYLNRGIVYIKTNKYEKALIELKHAMNLQKNSSLAQSLIGFVYQELQMYPESFEAHNKAVNLDSESSVALLNRSTFYKEVQQNLKQALLDINKAIDIDNECADGYVFRSQINRERGKLDESIADLKKAFSLAPKKDDICFKLSDIFLEKNFVDSALKYINKSIGINPSKAVYYSHLGNIYFDASISDTVFIDSARINHKKALILDPNNAIYHFNIAESLLKGGLSQSNIDSAIHYFSGAINLGFEISDCYNQRGLMYFYNGEPWSAIEDFDFAINQDPNIQTYYFNRAKAYLYLKDTGNAFADFKMANHLDSDYPLPYFYLGLESVLNFQQDLAINYFRLFFKTHNVVRSDGSGADNEFPYVADFMVQHQLYWSKPLANIDNEPVIAIFLHYYMLNNTDNSKEAEELLTAGLDYLARFTNDFNWVDDMFEKKLRPDDYIEILDKDNPRELQNAYFIIGMYYLHNGNQTKAKIYFMKCENHENENHVLKEIANHFLKTIS